MNNALWQNLAPFNIPLLYGIYHRLTFASGEEKKSYFPILVECMSPFGLLENRHDAH